ncbi:TetR/AcrR family transcriptional regulator [Sinanaerobacter chloroacetimidivorans]|jgi:TetR/AcrR family transcriptional regulator|uniref:TetR/AcrR family transcriptional regulator n=1 Tax=Sinanaerobacter chloroacetimidivorans TaxID=2818044 RepID=A0A8J8B3G6_9FIRM|nr:TetR/AcrR family transcriptional regulator [Sinanaerobacter chloroacetimidivorans]MBR0598300.1 TetR/AcrR family transcriptional regulator [Sinanaerobacter chloroacetimidivorans]
MKEKSFDRRSQLLEAAMEEFMVKSYEDASLNNIIKNAGISKGTFYYHFKDKQALYLTLLELAVEAKLEFLTRNIGKFSNNEEKRNFFDILKLQGRVGVEFAKTHPKYYRMGMMFTREKGNKIYDVAKKLLGSNTEKVFEEMIEEAIERGDFKNNISKDFILRIITHLFVHYDEIFSYYDDDGTAWDFDSMLDQFDHFVDFIQYGLRS